MKSSDSFSCLLNWVSSLRINHTCLVLEIRRGCTRGCRFCQPGTLTCPARDVELEQIIKTLEEGIRQTVHNEFFQLSLSCSDYLSL